MKKISFLIVVLVLVEKLFSQSYEGVIEFRMETSKDTTKNIYYIKGQEVRLDQIGRKSGKVEGSFLFDLPTHQIRFVNPVRKVWGDHKSETVPIIKGTFTVVKGSNTKTIHGHSCVEYIVKNTTEDIQITYWIASGKYDFFIPMVIDWNRKDKQNVYFNQIKNLPKGSMPFMSEEKQISDSKLLSRLEVFKINPSSVDKEKMTIPADYKKFEQK